MVQPVKSLAGLPKSFAPQPVRVKDPTFQAFVLNLSDLLQGLFAAPVALPRTTETSKELAPEREVSEAVAIEDLPLRPKEEAPPPAPRREVEAQTETEQVDSANDSTAEGGSSTPTLETAPPSPEEPSAVPTQAVETESPTIVDDAKPIEAPVAAPVEAPVEAEPVAPERYKPIELPTTADHPDSEPDGRPQSSPPPLEAVAEPESEPPETEPRSGFRVPGTSSATPEQAGPAPADSPATKPDVRTDGPEARREAAPPPSPAARAEATPPPPPAPPTAPTLPPQASAVAEVRVESAPRGEGRGFGGELARDPRGAAGAVRASRPAAPAADPSRVEFVERLMKAARFTMLKGQSRMKLVLNPPNLGHLRVDLSVKEHVLRGSLRAETSAARDLIVSQLPALKDQLERQGIQVGNLDVGVDLQHGQAGRQESGRPEPAPRSSLQESPEPRPSAERPRSARSQLIDVMA